MKNRFQEKNSSLLKIISLFLQKHTHCLVAFLAIEQPRSVAEINNYIFAKLQVQPFMSQHHQ